jgi:hypothetical protein
MAPKRGGASLHAEREIILPSLGTGFFRWISIKGLTALMCGAWEHSQQYAKKNRQLEFHEIRNSFECEVNVNYMILNENIFAA